MVARISSAPFTMHGVVPHSWMNHLPTFSLHEHGKGISSTLSWECREAVASYRLNIV